MEPFQNSKERRKGDDAASDPNTFIAPVAGVYHFSVGTTIDLNSSFFNISSSAMHLYINGTSFRYIHGAASDNNANGSEVYLSTDVTIHLNIGDKVNATVVQYNSGFLSASEANSSFSGHLVYAD